MTDTAALLLTGATSQLGDALLPMLHERDTAALACSRTVQAPGDDRVRWLHEDLGSLRVPHGMTTLVHLAPIWLLPALLQRSDCQGLRVLAISSCSLHAKADSPSLAERALAQRLSEAETALWALAQRDGHQLTLLRPTMLYGAGRDATVAPLQRCIRRWRVLPFPALDYGLRQPVHVEDVAAAILACLDNPRSIGKAYDLGGAERLRLDTLARRLFSDNGLRPRLLPVPRQAVALAISLLRRWRGSHWDSALLQRALRDQVADNRAASTDFGYAPRSFDGRFPPVIQAGH